MGTGRKMEKGTTENNMAKNGGERTKRGGLELMDRIERNGNNL